MSRLEEELAVLDGAAPVPLRTEPATDGFTRRQWDLIRDMKARGVPPPDPTNAKADDPAAAAMGAKLFADASFSPSGAVSCFTCHPSDKGFNDGHDVSRGVTNGDRNAPAIQLASQSRWMFWDGRADSLWAQAAGPFENKVEYDSTRLFVVHGVYERYRAEYEAVFGPLPPLNDPSRFPPIGKPGDATWSLMTKEDQAVVTRVYVNVAKAIAAFERTLRPAPSALDRYAGGDPNALTSDQKSGLAAFFDSGCVQCHYGPRLTDDAFHNMRFPTGRRDGAADTGRLSGVALLESGELGGRIARVGGVSCRRAVQRRAAAQAVVHRRQLGRGGVQDPNAAWRRVLRPLRARRYVHGESKTPFRRSRPVAWRSMTTAPSASGIPSHRHSCRAHPGARSLPACTGRSTLKAHAAPDSRATPTLKRRPFLRESIR